MTPVVKKLHGRQRELVRDLVHVRHMLSLHTGEYPEPLWVGAVDVPRCGIYPCKLVLDDTQFKAYVCVNGEWVPTTNYHEDRSIYEAALLSFATKDVR